MSKIEIELSEPILKLLDALSEIKDKSRESFLQNFLNEELIKIKRELLTII